LENTVKHKVDHEFHNKKTSHQKKLDKLLHNRRQSTNGTDKKWVVNLSSQPLSSSQEAALKLGLNYAITPKKVPVAHILAFVESGIKQVPTAEADIIRASITSILRNTRPPQQANISQDQLNALKSLADDPTITILPADKGRAVVIMDSSIYNDKIDGLLQDKKTYTKITRLTPR